MEAQKVERKGSRYRRVAVTPKSRERKARSGKEARVEKCVLQNPRRRLRLLEPLPVQLIPLMAFPSVLLFILDEQRLRKGPRSSFSPECAGNKTHMLEMSSFLLSNTRFCPIKRHVRAISTLSAAAVLRLLYKFSLIRTVWGGRCLSARHLDSSVEVFCSCVYQTFNLDTCVLFGRVFKQSGSQRLALPCFSACQPPSHVPLHAANPDTVAVVSLSCSVISACVQFYILCSPDCLAASDHGD